MPRILGLGTRRDDPRTELSKLATLCVAGAETAVTMQDLSGGGVSILVGNPPQPDQRYTLTYFVGGMQCTAKLEVVRSSRCGQYFLWGCRRKVLTKDEVAVDATDPRILLPTAEPVAESVPSRGNGEDVPTCEPSIGLLSPNEVLGIERKKKV